ncbi:MAG: DUF4249 domain-containing protein [Bacteroidales bacterium]|nr:DUF4249 domain-containing protein [Bacteroidales bacterium]
MIKKSAYINLLIVMVLLVSCEDTIQDLEIKLAKKKMVIYARCVTDSSLILNLTNSYSITDVEDHYPITDAAVSVTSPIDVSNKLSHTGDGWYQLDDKVFLPNNTYQLNFSAQGYDPVSYRLDIPPLPVVNVLEVKEIRHKDVQMNVWEHKYQNTVLKDTTYQYIFEQNIEYEIETNPNIDQYFLVEVFTVLEKLGTYEWDYQTLKRRSIPYREPIIIKIPMWIQDSRAVMFYNGGYNLGAPGIYDRSTGILLTNRNTKGSKLRFSIKDFGGAELNNQFFQNYSIQLNVSSITPSFYRYFKNRHAQREFKDDFFSEPLNMETDIENGFGLIYGQSMHEHTITKEEFPLLNNLIDSIYNLDKAR